MVGRDHALQLLHQVLALVPADQAEATLLIQDQALTRFANNSIHQNVVRKDARLAVRAVVDGRMGAAMTNLLDGEGQRRVGEQAAAFARLQVPDPEFPGLPAGRPWREAITFYEGTAGATAGQRAQAVRVLVDAASRLGFQATGAFATEVGELAIASTAGVAAYAPLTLASLRTVVDAGHGQEIGVLTGYADAISRDLDQIDPQAVAARAVEKCALNRDPQLLPAGRYVAILEEIAVADLLHFLARLGLSAQAVHEGRSFAVGKMGQRVCGENLTLWDDAADPRGLALPFDWEGVPAGRLELLSSGILRGLAHDSRSAAREGRPSTGHAQSQLFDHWSLWPAPTHLFVAPGDTAREALIAGVEHGVLITRFHYTHCPEPQQLVATGTTRDGTFVVKDGRIAGALRNLRFTQSVLETFSNIEALSSTAELHRDWWGSAAHYVPAMLVRDFNLAGEAG
jgi:predicted Zn-dependent protease